LPLNTAQNTMLEHLKSRKLTAPLPLLSIPIKNYSHWAIERETIGSDVQTSKKAIIFDAKKIRNANNLESNNLKQNSQFSTLETTDLALDPRPFLNAEMFLGSVRATIFLG
jgi:hypothetical protein